ncbi:hypothetical protein COOONC_05983, partial [Cooperia oncophora]
LRYFTFQIDIADTLDDVSDISESEKESPVSNLQLVFLTNVLHSSDLVLNKLMMALSFWILTDMEFLNDRNRQLHYLINKPRLVDIRNLTCDALSPWSESLQMTDGL